MIYLLANWPIDQKGHALLIQLAWQCRCHAVKFSGLIFECVPISEHCSDGFPESIRSLQYNADLSIIGVPPTIVALAAQLAASKPNVDDLPLRSNARLCAVFERFGYDGTTKESAQNRELDIVKQMEAWCDKGDSLRTETDLLHPEGVQLFRERFYDILD